MECDSGSKKIEETVIGILRNADLEEATEFKVRTMAAERLGVDLSGLDHKRLVRRVVETFLLSLEDNQGVLREPQSRTDAVALKEANRDGDRVVFKLSDKRNVAVQDFRGKVFVSIRDYYQKDGKQLPSNRGISLTPEQWSTFKKNVPAIEVAIMKMESRIRSEEVGKPHGADLPTSATAVASQGDILVEGKQVEADMFILNAASTPQGLSHEDINQSGEDLSNTVTASENHGSVPVTRKHMSDMSISNTASTPQGPTHEDINQSEDLSNTVSASDPRQVVPVARKHLSADLSNSTNHFNPQGVGPDERIQNEAEMSSSATYFVSQGRFPTETTRFDGKNYRSWVHQMEFFLQQSKIAYVLFEPCPSVTTSSGASVEEIAQAKAVVQKWIDDNYICRRNILSSLADHLFEQYSKRPCRARELWEELKLLYNDDFGTKRCLVNKYIKFQMVDGLSILEQVEELDIIANNITASGIWIDMHFHANVIISKLPPSWKEFRVKLLHEDFLPLNMLMHRLKVEEESRNQRKKVHHPFMEAHGQELRRKNKPGPRKRDMKRAANYRAMEKDKKVKLCYMCGDTGHVSKDCSLKKDDIRDKRNEKDNRGLLVVTEDIMVDGNGE